MVPFAEVMGKMEKYFKDAKHLGELESLFYLLLLSAEVTNQVRLFLLIHLEYLCGVKAVLF